MHRKINKLYIIINILYTYYCYSCKFLYRYSLKDVLKVKNYETRPLLVNNFNNVNKYFLYSRLNIYNLCICKFKRGFSKHTFVWRLPCESVTSTRTGENTKNCFLLAPQSSDYRVCLCSQRKLSRLYFHKLIQHLVDSVATSSLVLLACRRY